MEPVVLGWIATTLFSLAIIAQTVKTIKVKKTDGVSSMLFAMNLVANIVALCYATLIGQPPLQIKYIIGIIVSVIYLIVYAIYRPKRPKSELCHTYRRNG